MTHYERQTQVSWGLVFAQAALVLLAALCAAAVHYTRVEKPPSIAYVTSPTPEPTVTPTPEPTPAPVAAATPGVLMVTMIDAARAYDLYLANEAQFVDARDQEEWDAGHIPGAMLLPVAVWAQGYPPDAELLIPELLTVVYCSGGDCDSSKIVVEQLAMIGFQNLMILDLGYPVWETAGYPIEKKMAETEAVETGAPQAAPNKGGAQ